MCDRNEHQSLTEVKNKRDHNPRCVKCQAVFLAGVVTRLSTIRSDAMAYHDLVDKLSSVFLLLYHFFITKKNHLQNHKLSIIIQERYCTKTNG